jgi:hypothetical protein
MTGAYHDLGSQGQRFSVAVETRDWKTERNLENAKENIAPVQFLARGVAQSD